MGPGSLPVLGRDAAASASPSQMPWGSCEKAWESAHSSGDPVPLCCQDIILTVKEKLSIRSIEYFALALEEQYSVSRLHLLHEEELIQQVGGPTCSGAAKLLGHIRAGVFCTHSAWG